VSIKSLFFLLVLVVGCVGALRWPLVGALGYMMVYLVDPTSQWWAASIPFQRYSLLSASFLAVGLLLNWSHVARYKPRFGKFDLLLIAFLGIMWLSLAVGSGPTTDSWQLIDKMTKLFIFLFMFRWVVTTPQAAHAVFWCLLLGGLYVAWEGFTAPSSFFAQGRLTGLGSSDFAGANDFGIHLAATLPIAAALLIRFRRIWQRGLVVATVVLMMNTIVLTRSRSAFLSLAGGFVVALIYSPRKYRMPLVFAAVLGVIGFLTLADPAFWKRMQTIEEGEQEASTAGRIIVWRASVPMFRDHPLGVGLGNFDTVVKAYVKQGQARDTHNTYITCYTELGVQGAVVFLLILISTWRSLGRATRLARSLGEHDLLLYVFALRVSFVVYLVGGLTIKRTYAECFWWFLVLPAALLHILTVLQRQQAMEAPSQGALPEDEREPDVPGSRGIPLRIR
jgi:probable O-glycosylation ligase (exosortase A-associated)